MDKITIYAPIKGKVVDLKDIPDPVFSEKMLGDGLAIAPIGSSFKVPLDGTIISIPESLHACILKPEGTELELLIHIGIDSVGLAGKGFTAKAKTGDTVKTGDDLIEADWSIIKSAIPSTTTPILCTMMDKIKGINFLAKINSEIETGSPLFEIIL